MKSVSESPLRILFVCPSWYPINCGGHQRVSHLVAALSRMGDVTLLYPSKDGMHGPNLAALSPFCKEVFTFPIESIGIHQDVRLPKPLFWLIHKLRYLHPTSPALTQHRHSEAAKELLERLCSKPFDLVWAERLYSMRMLPSSLSSRVLVDLDDLEHRSFGRQPRLKKLHYMTPLYWLEFLKLRRLELSLCRLPYEFVVCSEFDKEVLGADPKVWVVPNGIDMPAGSPAREAQDTPSLVFVGSMSGPPNVDAVLFFHRSVLPLIRRRIPEVRFFIVGSDPSPEIRALHDGERVIVTGTVPEVSSHLRRATAFVAPIRFGGGTRIKILEAMAHGSPVVSTSMGAEGLELQNGKHLLIADSPETFAEACIRLLEDEPFRERIGRQGYQEVRDRYEWSIVERTVHDLVLGAARTPVRAAG